MYMGRDKFENEDLIKFGWNCDLWFHVDDLSSAHVYLRLPKGFTLDTIPESVLEECSQLVKANSIQGNKEDNIKIVYTMWSNLKKRKSMATGQIGFHDRKACHFTKVEKRKNEIVNALNKTKEEKDSSFIKTSWEEYQRKERQKERRRKKKEAAEIKKLKEEEAKAAKLRSYEGVMDNENDMTSNADITWPWEV